MGNFAQEPLLYCRAVGRGGGISGGPAELPLQSNDIRDYCYAYRPYGKIDGRNILEVLEYYAHSKHT